MGTQEAEFPWNEGHIFGPGCSREPEAPAPPDQKARGPEKTNPNAPDNPPIPDMILSSISRKEVLDGEWERRDPENALEGRRGVP